jgi:predicted acylesterase/phospholipase RssA
MAVWPAAVSRSLSAAAAPADTPTSHVFDGRLLADGRMAAYPPDALVEVPRSVCRSLEFYRAAEVIDIGRELAATVLDELEKPTPES